MFTEWGHALLSWNLQEAATLSKPPSAGFWTGLAVRAWLRGCQQHHSHSRLGPSPSRACHAEVPAMCSEASLWVICGQRSHTAARAGPGSPAHSRSRAWWLPGGQHLRHTCRCQLTRGHQQASAQCWSMRCAAGRPAAERRPGAGPGGCAAQAAGRADEHPRAPQGRPHGHGAVPAAGRPGAPCQPPCAHSLACRPECVSLCS